MIRIGNASGFYGDRFAAVEEMLTGGELDVLTGDYLAELTMLILARDRARDPRLGYARTFLRQMESTLGLALDKRVRIVVNAGGLNPAGLASALAALGERLGLTPRIGYVTGDEVPAPGALAANAYLGAFGIASCLAAGADVVVTGRVTDASLVVGPAIDRYGWTRTDYDALAGATVAGHILECGAQATGGNFAFFTELADGRHPGFPIAEVAADGSCVVTKHPGTGGAVTVETVTAQLLYEIAAPAYLGPDVVAHFDTIALHGAGPDPGRAGVLPGRRRAGARLLPRLFPDHPTRRRRAVRRLHRRLGTAGRRGAHRGSPVRRAGHDPATAARRRPGAGTSRGTRRVRPAGSDPARTARYRRRRALGRQGRRRQPRRLGPRRGLLRLAARLPDRRRAARATARDG